MIVSLNWIKQYVDISMPIDQLTELVGARLVEIEETIDLGKRYRGVLVAKVVSCEAHPNADKLSVCMIDDGGKVKGIKRDSKGLVQVVCGAPNVRRGMMVAWLPPKTTVPASFDDDEPFVLGARELRGVVSNGMLASAKELAIGDSHEGILEIDVSAKPGDDFAKLYQLDDYLLDIENKSLTHRPDCFGVIGLAREIAAITSQQFNTPDWLLDTKATPARNKSNATPLKVTIKDPELCPRYQAVVLGDIAQIVSSNVQLQTWLARVGVKPINAVVDVTNYLALLTGQPLHAFDYDKFVSIGEGKAEVVVRAGKKGETLELLDGRNIELTSQDIIIASGTTPVALAGAMGGSSTAIDSTTKNILLESASFNLYNLRATQMRHGIFTDAITRFTKGQSPQQTAPVLLQASQMLEHSVGAKVSSVALDEYPIKQKLNTIVVDTKRINQILGTQFSQKQISLVLQHVECRVETEGETLKITVPYWRADLHSLEDIVDEIGRINGFDKIAASLPNRSFTAVEPNELQTFKQKIRNILQRAGANDILTYSFVHGDLLEAVGQKRTDSFAIVNAISPRLEYYRQTLTPSLLEIVHPNIKAGTDECVIYEINKTHNKQHTKSTSGLPDELEMIAMVYANKKTTKGSPYFVMRRNLDFLASQLGLIFDYQPIDKKPDYPVTAPFDFARSAFVTEKQTGTFIGIIGEYRTQVIKNLKLPQSTAGCELGVEDLLKAVQGVEASYEPLGRYPGTSQDVTLQVDQSIRYSAIKEQLVAAFSKQTIKWRLAPLGIYQADDSVAKNVTFRIHLSNPHKTITKDEATTAIATALEQVVKKLKAQII